MTLRDIETRRRAAPAPTLREFVAQQTGAPADDESVNDWLHGVEPDEMGVVVTGLLRQLAEVTADRDALRERLAELASQMPGGINDSRIYSEETVRVRIAVAVGPNGHWGASGWCVGGGCADADDVAFEVAELDYEAARLSYVEADVPLPAPDRVLTIDGKVAREGEGVEG